MYADAAAQYKELVNLDRQNYNNIIEYRDYCNTHAFDADCAKASMQAMKLKEENGETDFTSAKIYLKWLNETDDKSIYSFVKDCVKKFSG